MKDFSGVTAVGPSETLQTQTNLIIHIIHATANMFLFTTQTCSGTATPVHARTHACTIMSLIQFNTFYTSSILKGNLPQRFSFAFQHYIKVTWLLKIQQLF